MKSGAMCHRIGGNPVNDVVVALCGAGGYETYWGDHSSAM